MKIKTIISGAVIILISGLTLFYLMYYNNTAYTTTVETTWLSENGTIILPLAVRINRPTKLYQSPVFAIVIDELAIDGQVQTPAYSNAFPDNINLTISQFDGGIWVYSTPITQLMFAAEKNEPTWTYYGFSIYKAKVIDVKYRLRTPDGILKQEYLLHVRTQ